MNRNVAAWQSVLKARGFDVGPQDGDFGPRTLKASLAAIATAPDRPETLAPPIKPAAPSLEADFPLVKARRKVNELIWHTAATPEGRDFTVSDIDAWHRKRGWAGIGYHYVIYRDGSIHNGRSVHETGAHVSGHNTGTIGAVYIGGVTADGKTAKDTRTPEQRASMRWLTIELAKLYGLKKISGHNQYAAKACPSFDVRTDDLGNIPGYSRGERTST